MNRSLIFSAVIFSGVCISLGHAQTGQQTFPSNYQPAPDIIVTSAEGSTYVPMDSWIYPALDRLHSLGYLDTAFLGLRPWTRLNIAHMLEASSDQIDNSNDEQAKEIYLAVLHEVQPDIDSSGDFTHPSAAIGSVYTEFRGIDGTPLRDSFHLGQTIVNDYGRPYESGFNDYTGFSVRAVAGRFSLYYRGEYQHAPDAAGYSPALAQYLSQTIDQIPWATNPNQATIPEGPIAAADNARVLEATLGFKLWGHEISFGKSDHWMGPDQGDSMLYSDNAQDIYQFQIDKVDPFRIPLLSRLIGPLRYDFFVGSLKGHTDPNDPWVHAEKISFKPTKNLEFGFSRMVIWGGKDHEPITLHTFLKSFFSFQDVSESEKFSRADPGYRLGNFDFDYRLPFLRDWVTLYTDSLVHDDVSPIDAPRRAAYHTGIYLARFPGLQKLDLRVEAASTDPGPVGQSNLGRFFYWETIQRQGPTNEGFLMGDWVGRQGKGGQAWLTYHLSAKNYAQIMFRRAEDSNKFLPGGTSQDDFAGSVQHWLGRDIELQGLVQYEAWKAPILTYPDFSNAQHNDTTVDVRITWHPHQQAQ